MPKATIYITETRRHEYKFAGSHQKLQDILDLHNDDPDGLADYCSSMTLQDGEYEIDDHKVLDL